MRAVATDATGKGQLTVQARTTLDALPVALPGGGGLGLVAQEAEPVPYKDEVAGSSPARPFETSNLRPCGSWAAKAHPKDQLWTNEARIK